MRRLGLTFVSFVVIIIAAAQCGGKPLSPEKLLEERCTRCHTLAPIQAAGKTRHEWESTVYRMISKGARLSDQEAETVIDYLAENYGPR